MTIAAVGPLSTALIKLQELVAASTTFRAAVDAASAAAAKEKILLDYAEDEELYQQRPFAVVCESQFTYRQLGEGDGILLGAGGGLLFELTANAESPENHFDSKILFCNFVGQVIAEMAELSGRDEYFPMRSCEFFQFPQRTAPTKRNENNDYWSVIFAINYGVLE